MSEVSVVVPVRNGAAYLRATLVNVLASDHRDFEVVVLDNASTDETAAILADFDDPRLRVHRNDECLDLPANWQKATELAQGRFIKVVCADDLVRSDALRRQAAVLSSDDTVALVASRRHFIDAEGRVLSYCRGLPGLVGRHSARAVARRITALGVNPLGESAAIMFRRDDFVAVGGWRGELTYPMDADLWLRLLSRGDMVGQPEALAAFRIAAGTLSSRHDEQQLREQASFVSRVAHDPQWGPGLPGVLSTLAVRAGWVAWSLRSWLWHAPVLGAPRALGQPAPWGRSLFPW